MLAAFRAISVIEGLSLLALLLIAMPAKYYFDNHSLVPIVGMAHGILWLAYIIMGLMTAQHQQWSVWFWLMTLLLSVVPLGFIVVEWMIRRQNQAQ